MKRAYVDDLEDYYGFEQGSYTIILAPLFHKGGFGPTIQNPCGLSDSYYIGGPRQIANDMPDYGEEKSMQYLFWHEFSHSFVNHLTDKIFRLFAFHARSLSKIQTKAVLKISRVTRIL